MPPNLGTVGRCACCVPHLHSFGRKRAGRLVLITLCVHSRPPERTRHDPQRPTWRIDRADSETVRLRRSPLRGGGMLARDLGKSFERSFREQVVVVQQFDPVADASEHRVVCILHLAPASAVLNNSDARLATRVFRQGGAGPSLRSFIVTDHQFPVAKVLTQHAVVSPANRVRAAEGWNGYRNERALPRNMAGMGLAGWRKAPFLSPSRL